MAATWRMLPPSDSLPGNPLTVLGRTYSCPNWAFLDVPDFDGHYLRSAGWTMVGIVGQYPAPASTLKGDSKVNVNLAPPFGSNVTQLQGLSGTVYNVVNGFVSVTSAGDVTAALNAGWSFAKTVEGWYTAGGGTLAAPAVVNNTFCVGVSALAAAGGGFTINAQPDWARKLVVVTSPGTISISSGVLSVTGVDNTGTAYTDTLNLSATAGAGHTYTLTHGCLSLTSAGVGAITMTGGASIAIGTTNHFCLPLPPNFQNLSILKGMVDATTINLTSLTIDTGVGSVFYPTASDTTHVFSAGYSYVLPGQP